MNKFLLVITLFITVSMVFAEETPEVYRSEDDGTIIVELEADTLSPYLQAQTLITLRLYRDPDSFDAAMSYPELSDPVVNKNAMLRSIEINKRRYRKYKNNRLYTVTEREYVIYPEQSGPLTIGPSTFKGHIVQGGTIKFAQVESNILEMDVRPIPETFTGNIWIPARSVELYQDFQPSNDSIEIGKPISRNLFISATGLGSGHIPSFYSTQIPGFRVYPRQTKREELEHAESGLIAVLQQELALVPNAVGKYEIPEIRVPWWNTIKDKEEVAYFPGKIVTILPLERTVDENQQRGKRISQNSGAVDQPVDSDKKVESSMLFLLLLLLLTFVLLPLSRYVLNAFGIRKMHLRSKNTLLRKALTACYLNKPIEASSSIQDYFKVCLPQYRIRSLLELSGHMEAEFKSELMTLNSALYSPHEQSWDGEFLAELLKDWQSFHRDFHQSVPDSLLPELHPLSQGK